MKKQNCAGCRQKCPKGDIFATVLSCACIADFSDAIGLHMALFFKANSNRFYRQISNHAGA
jgi:hypothetical protein